MALALTDETLYGQTVAVLGWLGSADELEAFEAWCNEHLPARKAGIADSSFEWRLDVGSKLSGNPGRCSGAFGSNVYPILLRGGWCKVITTSLQFNRDRCSTPTVDSLPR